MKNKKKLLDWRLIVSVITLMTVAIYFTTAGSMNFFVNGKQVASNQGQPFVQNGVTYVPLQATMKGMGGAYTYNSKTQTATIKGKGSKQAITIKNGQTVAKIGNKSVALKTKTVNKKVVNDGRKALIVKNVFYVPVDFVKTQFKYPVTIKKEGSKTTVYIGEVPKPVTKPVTPAPKPVTPAPKPVAPAPKPVAPAPQPVTPAPTPQPTINKESVVNSLVANQYYKHSNTLATLNIFNPGGSGNMSVAVDLTNDKDMYVKIRAWEDPYIPESKMIPSKVKTALDLIIPSGSAHIYKITEQVAKTGSHPEMNKTFTYNGLKTKVTFDSNVPEVKVVFSK